MFVDLFIANRKKITKHQSVVRGESLKYHSVGRQQLLILSGFVTVLRSLMYFAIVSPVKIDLLL